MIKTTTYKTIELFIENNTKAIRIIENLQNYETKDFSKSNIGFQEIKTLTNYYVANPNNQAANFSWNLN